MSTSSTGAGSSDHQLNAIQSTSAFPGSLFSDFFSVLFAALKGQMGKLVNMMPYLRNQLVQSNFCFIDYRSFQMYVQQ